MEILKWSWTFFANFKLSREKKKCFIDGKARERERNRKRNRGRDEATKRRNDNEMHKQIDKQTKRETKIEIKSVRQCDKRE